MMGLPPHLLERWQAFMAGHGADDKAMRALMAMDFAAAHERGETLDLMQQNRWRVVIKNFTPAWCSGTYERIDTWQTKRKLPAFQLAYDSVITGLSPRAQVWQEALCDTPWAERKTFVRLFGWCIPSLEVLTALSAYHDVRDPFAGTGWWARLIHSYQRRGGKVQAADAYEEDYDMHFGVWYPVKRGRVERFKGTYSHLTLVAWPCYKMTHDLMAYKQVPPGGFVCYIGEGRGGCTGSGDGMDYLKANFTKVQRLEIPNWSTYLKSDWKDHGMKSLNDFVLIARRKRNGE